MEAAERGSLTAAAAALGVPKPALFPFVGTLGANNLGFVASAIEADGGIGMMPELMAIGLMARAPIERVLAGWEMPAATMSLLWPVSRHLSPRVRAFIDFFVAHMAGGPGCV